jgi:hypothetical protein
MNSNTIGEISPRIKLLLVLIAPLAFVLVNCDNSPTKSADTSPNYFPQRIGSVWLYEKYVPYTSAYYDTVKDSITRVVSDSFRHSFVEIKESSFVAKWVHYIYQRMSGDSVSIYWSTILADSTVRSDKLFVLPFDSGRWWQNNWNPCCAGPTDSFWVTGNETVTVPAGTFLSSATIHRELRFLNVYGNFDYWFADGVGVVKKYESYPYPWMYDLISYRVSRHLGGHRRGGE